MAESIVSQKFKFVVGVDTHAKTHFFTLVDNKGVLVGKREVKVTDKAIDKAIFWIIAKTKGNVLFAIEGTSSYGETLAIALKARGFSVCEVKPPRTKSRGQALVKQMS
jgi:transposase